MLLSMLKSLFNRYAPDAVYAVLASLYWTIRPDRATQIVYPVDGCWLIWTPTEMRYALPASDPSRRYSPRGTKKFQLLKYSQYNLEGFVSVESDDIVVDIGALVGEFTIPASHIAKQVIAIEPNPRTYKCLAKQCAHRQNITTVQQLLGETAGTVPFQMGDDPSESSLLSVDEGGYETIEIECQTLDTVMDRLDISQIDFLKMDAEGAEPEVLRGWDDIKIRKLAIDAGSERDGERTSKAVEHLLQERGYETRVKGSIVFAKQ